MIKKTIKERIQNMNTEIEIKQLLRILGRNKHY